jgi:phosphoglycerate kinase
MQDTGSSVTGSDRPRRVRSIRDAEVDARRVLVRADLNVPLENGRIADDKRIRASLPTLEHLRERGAASITVCSHLGRPDGEDRALSLKPVEARLRELYEGPLTVLENTRFSSGEARNDPAFAQALADGNDLFVQDAFGSVHRPHASIVGVANLLPTYAGLLLDRELEQLGRLLGEVERPYVVVCGGDRAADKLGALRQLGGRADSVLVGGKMAEQLRVANPFEFPIELPVDVVGAARFDPAADGRVYAIDELPYGWIGLDIGPETRARFAVVLAGARTIFWNGPMGAFEWPLVTDGTKSVAWAVAGADAYSVAGGADSVRALNELGLADDVSWASTGGRASLEFLEGKELPGVVVIPSA